MSQTDTRPGFRLPWTAERPDADQPTDGATEATSAELGAEASTSSETDAVPAGEGQGVDGTTPAEEFVTTETTETAASTGARRPTKFMADLSRAMQTAAEASRDETMVRFGADAKVAVEDIRSKSAEEAAGLRRQADDDVAAVREWSKAEIARIREETDSRIAARKQALDGEMDAFAAVIEARVERVNRAVAEFENEMSEFFERLMGEQDPTRIATMAQAMPDPPELSALAAAVTEAAPQVEPAIETEAETEATQPEGEYTAEAEAAAEEAAPEAEGTTYDDGSSDGAEAQAEGEAVTEGVAETAESEAPAEGEMIADSVPDFAAAEAEAAAMSGGLDSDDGLTMLAAARLDSADADVSQTVERSTAGDRVTTRVVVLGLVSVASIATFKRSLGRVAGVSAIGVASGPDGEFVFTVSHDTGLGLANAITALPGFEARITAESPDGLEVAAHDPDSAD